MGRTFNPGEHEPKKGESHGTYLEVAGEYLLVISKVGREDNTKKPFRNMRFKVIHGPMKKKHFQNRIYFNDESLWKVGRLCAAMQFKSPFDLSNDSDVRSAMMYRPFKAKVTIRKQDDKSYADLGLILLETTPAEELIMDSWVAEYEAAGNIDPDALSDEGASTGGGRSSGGSWYGQGSPPPGDDDNIPFSINECEREIGLRIPAKGCRWEKF